MHLSVRKFYKVKGSILYCCAVLCSVLYDCLQYPNILQAEAVKGVNTVVVQCCILYWVIVVLQYPEILHL